MAKTENVNTCNDWGFGGIVAKRTTYKDGITHTKGKRYYRHASPSKVDDWYLRISDIFNIPIPTPHKGLNHYRVYTNGTRYVSSLDREEKLEGYTIEREVNFTL